MDWRKSFDATPWCDRGHAFNGLTRSQSRYLALVFIITGTLLASPPFIDPTPNDFMNFFVADWLDKLFGISFSVGLLASYIIVGPALILLGIWIYPYNSKILLFSYINKAKRFLQKSVRDPKRIAIGIILFCLMYNLYRGWLL